MNSIFLAGAIDNGAAVEWQEKIQDTLSKYYIVYNPRRKDWDSTIDPSVRSEKLDAQINWELDAINNSQRVLFFFPKNSKAPISFLELGYCLGKGKMIDVIVEDGFYRKANIEIICERNGIKVCNDLDKYIKIIVEEEEFIIKNYLDIISKFSPDRLLATYPMGMNWDYAKTLYPDIINKISPFLLKFHPSLFKGKIHDIRYPG